MVHTSGTYKEWYAILMETCRLRNMINMNYQLKIIPPTIIKRMVNQRTEFKKTIKTKYKNYKYVEKINGVNFFLN